MFIVMSEPAVRSYISLETNFQSLNQLPFGSQSDSTLLSTTGNGCHLQLLDPRFDTAWPGLSFLGPVNDC